MRKAGTTAGRLHHAANELRDREQHNVRFGEGVMRGAAGEPWQAYQGGGQGSMHTALSLADAAAAIDAGWAEPHLLAGRALGGGRAAVPAGLVLVYAPRTVAEIPAVLEILRAALAFATSGGSASSASASASTGVRR
jgi:hypothetical protein